MTLARPRASAQRGLSGARASCPSGHNKFIVMYNVRRLPSLIVNVLSIASITTGNSLASARMDLFPDKRSGCMNSSL